MCRSHRASGDAAHDEALGVDGATMASPSRWKTIRGVAAWAEMLWRASRRTRHLQESPRAVHMMPVGCVAKMAGRQRAERSCDRLEEKHHGNRDSQVV